MSAYLISGLCAAAAGVILTADTHTSDPVSEGLYIELDAILAVVIGGGSLAGGRIYLGGTVLGALVIQALTTSILTSGLPPEYNLVVKAVVVLVVLLLQSAKAQRRCCAALCGEKAMSEKYLPLVATIAVFAILFLTRRVCSTTTSSRRWCSATFSPTTHSSSSRRSARLSSSFPAASTSRSAR